MLKVMCPKCGTLYEVTDEAILKQVKTSKSLREKIATILGGLTGGKTRLNAVQRRERALKAVQAREAKRKRGH